MFLLLNSHVLVTSYFQELPTPFELRSRLPSSLFGDVLSLLEFFNTFGDLFDAADEFPDGVSLCE